MNWTASNGAGFASALLPWRRFSLLWERQRFARSRFCTSAGMLAVTPMLRSSTTGSLEGQSHRLWWPLQRLGLSRGTVVAAPRRSKTQALSIQSHGKMELFKYRFGSGALISQARLVVPLSATTCKGPTSAPTKVTDDAAPVQEKAPTS